MLKIKFTRKKNIVIMEILEQSNEIIRGSGKLYEGKNDIEIYTGRHPQLFTNAIYICGTDITKDNFLSVIEFSSIAQAQQFYTRAIEAVEGYNLSHSIAQEYEQCEEDIETYITG